MTLLEHRVSSCRSTLRLRDAIQGASHSRLTPALLPSWKPDTTVASMETGDFEASDPNDARSMLNLAAAAESETKNPPLSWAFFVTQALLLAGTCAAQMLPQEFSRILTIVGLAAVLGVGVRAVFYRPGYGVVWPDGAASFPYMVTMFVVVGVPAILALSFDLNWLWLVAAAGAALVTLGMGRQYRRAVTHA